MISTQLKQPAEALRLTPAFATTGALVELVDVLVAPRGLVPGAEVLTFEGVLAEGRVAVSVSGGSDGERYLVTTRVRDDTGQVLESEIEVAVVEASWQLPDGGTPWLSIADFVKRFGLDEVVRMTDADGSGRIGRDLLTQALADAQAIGETHLAGRYLLPLAEVPPILALSVADVARARLYPRGAPEGVDNAAKAALRTLERIQTGALPLALMQGTVAGTAAEAPSSAPVMIAPGKRRYPDGLADY